MRPASDNRDRNHQPSAEAKSVLLPVLKAVGDSLRLDILRVLSHDSFGVQELAGIFAVPQPGMSHHLKILNKAGLLETQRQGNSIFYRRSLVARDHPCAEFLDSLFRTVSQLPLEEAVLERIQATYSDRAAQSRLFFEKHVDKFRERQGQLCELDQYIDQLRSMMDLMRLPYESRVMEVGPGEGQLLAELAERFQNLVALDSSEEMLALTQKAMRGHAGIRYVRDSLEDFPSAGVPFDALLLNMVLHHMPSPQRTFEKARKLLRQDGFLLIADLCLHNQEWTRTSCGDVWLGFDPMDLGAWAEEEGFQEIQNLYLGLKNGFQIQLKLFCATSV
jgi:ArsR family transcriptional regulator